MSRSLGGTFLLLIIIYRIYQCACFFPSNQPLWFPLHVLEQLRRSSLWKKELVWRGLLQQLLHRSNPLSVGLLWKIYRPNNNEWKGISKWFLSYWLLSCKDENFYKQFNWLFLLLMRIMIISSKGVPTTTLCSNRARWPLAPNFCPWGTTKYQILYKSHTNHMLGTLDFTVSEHWVPFNFPFNFFRSLKETLKKSKLGALHCHVYLNNNKIIARLKLHQTRPPA